MTDKELEKLKFPIGREPDADAELTTEEKNDCIKIIEQLPAALKFVIKGLTDEQLDTPYRPGGWTPRILVHHLGDSHLNAFIRVKLALTESEPVIKPYYEDRWAKLADYSQTPIDISIKLLEGLHSRWVILLRSLSNDDLNRIFFHPERNRSLTVRGILIIYAWHCKHHLAHITEHKKRMG